MSSNVTHGRAAPAVGLLRRHRDRVFCARRASAECELSGQGTDHPTVTETIAHSRMTLPETTGRPRGGQLHPADHTALTECVACVALAHLTAADPAIPGTLLVKAGHAAGRNAPRREAVDPNGRNLRQQRFDQSHQPWSQHVRGHEPRDRLAHRVERMTRMAGERPSCKWGRDDRIRRIADKRVASIAVCHASSSRSAKDPLGGPPEFTTSRSSRPKRCTAAATAAAAPSAEDRSATTSMSPGVLAAIDPSPAVLETRATVAPSAASASAIAAPSPRLAPPTRAQLLRNSRFTV